MRYFIEVSYKGTSYAGFQVQQNANTIQGEVEKALSIILRSEVSLTGSSRTDAGVHAIQNYFHFDTTGPLQPKAMYNLNALLPSDIVVKNILHVADDAHCRFDAIDRKYGYYITTTRDPFNIDTTWFFPFAVNINLLNEAAKILYNHIDYTAFSKRNTQVKTFNCTITESVWKQAGTSIVYNVKANRFLRGMVRGLVGTMLLVGRKKISLADFEGIIESKDCTNVNFATPAHGLFLEQVNYPVDTLANR